MHEISISAEKIFSLYGQPITNSVIASLLTSLVIILLAIWYKKNSKLVPGRFQSIVELPVEGMYNLAKGIVPHHVNEVLPLVTTIFIFVLFANWSGLIPGISGIGVLHEVKETETATQDQEHKDVETENLVTTDSEEHAETVLTPIFRATTADLNTTIALAIISVIASHYFGIKHLGAKKHIGKFINLTSAGGFILGFFELVQELSKIISFSFRLFGNIFAGEVLIVVMGSLVPLLLPVPFVAIEIFVGLIQALVFAMLTLVFTGIALSDH